MKQGRTEIDRSRVELAAAQLLTDGGFHAQAVSRAYYAAFYAAEAALLSVGETRSKHAGVISAFGRHVIRAGKFDEQTGSLLRSLFERRNGADYEGDSPRADQAQRSIQDAERFVDAVGQWLSASSGPPGR